VFVTAYDEFAVRAFDTHALDYLVKPLEEARFAESLERMRERMRERLRSANAFELSRKLAALLATHEKELAKQRIVVPTTSGALVIDADEINWIEADDYYASIHARQGVHLIRESLNSLEERLDSERFIRIHRSAIVNIHSVSELRSKQGATVIVMKDGVCVPVSRRRRARLIGVLRRLQKT